MVETKEAYVTKDGLQKLQEELLELKSKKRREIADRIQQAKELGDLSENAEYVEAKNEQAYVEGRIIDLENILRNAVIIQKQKPGDVVEIGSTFEAETDGKQIKYAIVGSNEADPAAGRISNESPLGQAFLGHRIGEKITLETPKGPIEYTILSVQ